MSASFGCAQDRLEVVPCYKALEMEISYKALEMEISYKVLEMGIFYEAPEMEIFRSLPCTAYYCRSRWKAGEPLPCLGLFD